jgi:hypothetical protein
MSNNAQVEQVVAQLERVSHEVQLEMLLVEQTVAALTALSPSR